MDTIQKTFGSDAKQVETTTSETSVEHESGTTEGTDDSVLQLSYQNETGNSIVIREYRNHGEFVRGVDRELMYNYPEEKWETINRFTHDYELCDDGVTLAGDGSNWRGTGRNWRTWFTLRHYERLRIRFRNDEIPEDVESIAEHDPVEQPVRGKP